MPLCILHPDGYCERHRRRHIGHAAALAVEQSEKAEKIRRAWDGGGVSSTSARSVNLRVFDSCIHRGPLIDKTKCGIPVYQCKARGVCSTSRRAGVTLCQDCQDFRTKAPAPYQAIHTRHLLYHLYPVSGNGAWQWNVEQLCGRLKAFNGKKIVAIVTDPPTGRKPDPSGPFPPDRGRMILGCDSAAEVKAEFARRWGGDPITFLEMENDPNLREVATLHAMLELLPQDDPHSVFLYGQAKGVTRHPNHAWRRWTEAIYEVYFDHFPLAMEQLMHKPVTGAFQKLGPGWSATQSKSDHHYSGSFAWVRAHELFARDWRKIDLFWSGIEPFWSQHFLMSECDCMFHRAQVPEMNLYSANYQRRVVLPALAKWRVDNAKYRTELWPK